MLSMMHAHKAYVYALFKIFQPTIVRASWNRKENDTKNKCILKKAFFAKNTIRESGAITYALRTQSRSVTVDNMAGIFTKHIWQPWVPVTACVSSEKQLHVASTFGSKDIAWKVVAVRLRSSHTLIARLHFKETRAAPADVGTCGVCSFLQCAEKGLKDNATSPSKLLFRCSAASLHQATHSLNVPSKHPLTLQQRCLP